MKKIIVLISIPFTISWCNSSDYTWFYYPNKNDLSIFEQSWKLDSLQECRNWVNWQWYDESIWDYEFGYKCKYNNNYSMNICKTTKK